ncbi:hypothetical protein ACVWZW_008697 [Bradyrhizobium sp. F1.13.4]
MEPGFEQHCGATRLREHDEPVIAVDADILVEQLAPVAAHHRQSILAGIMQVPILQLPADHPGQHQARSVVRIPLRHEQRVARKAVAEIAVRAVELPGLDQLVRHRIVMNRQEEIGPGVIRGTDAFEQARPRLAVRDEQAGRGKAFGLEPRRDQTCKPEVEAELRVVACAQPRRRSPECARHPRRSEISASHI